MMKNVNTWICCAFCVVCSVVLITVGSVFLYHFLRMVKHKSICEIGQKELDEQRFADSIEDKYCPDGWENFGEHCYFYDSFQRSWQSAEDHCVSKGGHLASIHSAGEDCLIRRLVEEAETTDPSRLPGAWIGFTDKKKEGEWVWSDRTNVDYQQWSRGEPNQFLQMPENCATLFQLDRSYGWVDITCSARHGAVCKVHRDTFNK